MPPRTFHMLPMDGSHDTMDCLREWLKDAEEGRVVGLAAVVIYRQRSFAVRTCGEADRSPVFTRGCVGMLDDELGRRIRGDAT